MTLNEAINLIIAIGTVGLTVATGFLALFTKRLVRSSDNMQSAVDWLREVIEGFGRTNDLATRNKLFDAARSRREPQSNN